jgi:dTDP-4-dehydrorhamnose 3,5-epimerase
MTEFRALEPPGLVEIVPRRNGDRRGFFAETYRRSVWAANGVTDAFVQDNHSRSAGRYTLRGLHFQTPPHAQAKVVRVVQGRAWDVAVDLRRGSPSYGRWRGLELSADAGNQLYIPEGFAHGLLTLEPDTEVHYKVSAEYAPEHEAGLAWDDPRLAIAWPLDGARPILSEKDKRQPGLDGFDSPFVHADRAEERRP